MAADQEKVEAMPASEGLSGVKRKQNLDEILENIKKMPLKVTNVGGATAGSGSGDFHQYRQYRNAENRRIYKMEQEQREQFRQEEFMNKRKQLQEKAEQRML
eukprot:TRINITY_DN2270_c0_g1_i1.p5 TRINITY_DN2270_c0_g1~~TRINITY_DN2270_c0_g1_i1.p5  ORF type:complete len:102 (-),score=26.72 TRINITY_DN2270_c0_g1_i1:1741-2046(-)